MEEIVEVGSAIFFTIQLVVLRPKIGIQVHNPISEDLGYDVSLMEFILSADVPRRGVYSDEVRVELKVRGIVVCVDGFPICDFAKEGDGRVAVLAE